MADYPPIEVQLHHPIGENMDGSAIVTATQHLGHARKVTGLVHVSPEMLTDWSPPDLHDYVRRTLDRTFQPWNYPDRAITIRFDPFPRWTRLVARLRRSLGRTTQ